MSDAYAVPLDDVSWSFDPQEWLDAVHERWPEARVRLGGFPGEPTAAVAVLPAGNQRLEVVLDGDRQSVAFEPIVPDALAEFVAWWARRLPADNPPVHLFIGGDADRSLPLTRDLTAEDVLRFLATSE